MDKEQENAPDKKGTNTEYLPTKCRVTKPPPPKPAANPMQFVKVAPCPLFQKAQEQLKKVEEIKTARKEVREEAEDWQQNLDNWKSSRRKRQEHIIERVVEVKKLEQEENERSRRKNKTFSEMMEERKGRHKLNIPIYNDDDANDLSDYGIGSSSSKTNSIKDVDTDDNSSVLDEKDFASNKESSTSNQSQSEDETNAKTIVKSDEKTLQKEKNLYTNIFSSTSKSYAPPKIQTRSSFDLFSSNKVDINEQKEQYTYEGAIQDYRTRIRSKINIDESIFNKPHDYTKTREEVESVVPKGNIFKRKEIFEVEKATAENLSESSRRLSETFANAQSIKERLKSLEQCTDRSLKSVERTQTQSSVKERLQNFDVKQNDTKNNNNPKPPIKIDYANNNNNNANSTIEFDRSSSPEAEMYMNKLNRFNRDLDLMFGKSLNGLDDYGLRTSNYAPSTSSTELMTVSSDREDSGIHTADVSCAVSQSDELYEELDPSATIPKCIEKLSVVKENEKLETNESDGSKDSTTYQSTSELNTVNNNGENAFSDNRDINYLKVVTAEFLSFEIKDSLPSFVPRPRELEVVKVKKSPVIYENVEVKPYDTENLDFMIPITKLEPPKVKPPPPPPQDEIDGCEESNFKRINSTKRIKKEMHIKRSSFLGLDEPTDDQIDPDIRIDKPPDINTFLQKESRMEKCLYKKLQGSRDGSQDSGLEIERGRLSSDTWCSSLVDSSTPVHDRQDSEQTSSFTSEEDEITKKEREIIELVEKEEKSRDSDYSSQTTLSPVTTKCIPADTYDTLGSEKFDRPYFPPHNSFGNDIDEQDSEVLRVEAELKQLELEEFERQRDNMLFREKFRQNRHSLENICDTEIYPPSYGEKIDYRKSMPELQVASEYRKSLPDVPNYNPGPQVDFQYRKSMPDIQHAYNRSVSEYCNNVPSNGRSPMEYRKSMPELQERCDFRSPPHANRQQAIAPGKPLRAGNKDQRDKERYINKSSPVEMDPIQQSSNKQIRPLTRHSLHVLSAAPKPRHNDNWIQPKPNSEVKSYNQHWLYQEAELRRISEQNNSLTPQQRNWHQQRLEISDPRILNRTGTANMPSILRSVRSEHSPNKEYFQHPYLGHAQPLSYPPHVQIGDNQDKMLSVSGKKKCSNCSNELETLPKHSILPTSYKLATYRFMIHRAFTIPLMEDNLNKELNTILQISQNNGFNKYEIQTLINKKRKQITINQIYPSTNVENDLKYVTIMYLRPTSDKFVQHLSKNNIEVAFRRSQTVSKLLLNSKRKTLPHQKSGVYELVCHECKSCPTKAKPEEISKLDLRNLF